MNMNKFLIYKPLPNSILDIAEAWAPINPSLMDTAILANLKAVGQPATPRAMAKVRLKMSPALLWKHFRLFR